MVIHCGFENILYNRVATVIGARCDKDHSKDLDYSKLAA